MKKGIIFKDSIGNEISVNDLKTATGTYNYEIYGLEGVSEKAQKLHNEARIYGQKGDYEKTKDILLEAINEAPNWAYPYYDLADAYMLQDDYNNALKYYKLTDSLAPNGFYTSKTALFTLEKEKKGKFKQGLYKLYISLEWIDNQE